MVTLRSPRLVNSRYAEPATVTRTKNSRIAIRAPPSPTIAERRATTRKRHARAITATPLENIAPARITRWTRHPNEARNPATVARFRAEGVGGPANHRLSTLLDRFVDQLAGEIATRARRQLS